MAHFQSTRAELARALLAERNEKGVWEGELSTSALSTATAVCALSQVDAQAHEPLITDGLNWLTLNINSDGGWGDTIRSHSNISTTALCWAAFALDPSTDEKRGQAVLRAEEWLKQRTGNLSPQSIADAILNRYAEDHTFSVPILAMLAICGRLGKNGWDHVIPLPFELAAFPRKLFKWLQMPVVSYALPALIAIGQAIFYHQPKRNPFTALTRNLTKSKTLRALTSIQPKNGGFLEAIPLTAFVTMSLASMGLKDHQVAKQGISFIKSLTRPDGSWPIDTHLTTWVTTLSVNALFPGEYLDKEDGERILQWLLGQQYQKKHPFTDAAPGGWAWTPLPGGVPDADDTSGALVALANLDGESARVQKAATAGLNWLAGLQNRDGGLPTFCRGWGRLPFDKSCPDITAHAILAALSWKQRGLCSKIWDRMVNRGLKYLQREQRADGSWAPLWFGNQDAPDEENPTYGTARVLISLQPLQSQINDYPDLDQMIEQGRTWLVKNAGDDGSWGGSKNVASSLEETALAVHALCGEHKIGKDAFQAGLRWMEMAVKQRRWETAAPIGFYFANLWYFEKLYPLVFAVGAMEAAHQESLQASRKNPAPPSPIGS